MKHFILCLLISLSAWSSDGKFEEAALSMVPRSHVVEKRPTEYVVKSAAGTKIRIEFHRSGKLQEASGHNLNKGDEFEPGLGLLSLSSAARKVMDEKLRFLGHWSLEKDPKSGWFYEFHVERDSEPEYVHIHAKTGRELSSMTEIKVPASSPAKPEPKHHKEESR